MSESFGKEGKGPDFFSSCNLQIAGRSWLFERVRLYSDAHGQMTISEADMQLFRLSVANRICNEDSELRRAEFELLCQLTQCSFKEVAQFLRKDKSTVSRWANKMQIDYAESRLLKDFFWTKLFGDVERRRSEMHGRHELACQVKGLLRVEAAS